MFDKAKGTYFSESHFVKAIQTPGAVILLEQSDLNQNVFDLKMDYS